MAGDQSVVRRDDGQAALGRALALRAEATTDAASSRRSDMLRDKQKAVADFFSRAGKSPTEVDTATNTVIETLFSYAAPPVNGSP